MCMCVCAHAGTIISVDAYLEVARREEAEEESSGPVLICTWHIFVLYVCMYCIMMSLKFAKWVLKSCSIEAPSRYKAGSNFQKST